MTSNIPVETAEQCSRTSVRISISIAINSNLVMFNSVENSSRLCSCVQLFILQSRTVTPTQYSQKNTMSRAVLLHSEVEIIQSKPSCRLKAWTCSLRARSSIQDNLRSCESKLLEKNVLCLPRTVPKIRCLLPHTTLAFCVMFLYTACSKEYCITNQFNNIWQQKVYYNYKKYNFLSMHRIFKSRVYRALLSPEGV